MNSREPKTTEKYGSDSGLNMLIFIPLIIFISFGTMFFILLNTI